MKMHMIEVAAIALAATAFGDVKLDYGGALKPVALAPGSYNR